VLGTVDAARIGHTLRGEDMRFPYTLSVAPSIDTGEQIVLLRPEIPIRVYGPTGAAEMLALVDTGADNSILPLSIAHDLGIQTTPGSGPGATAFGGQQSHFPMPKLFLMSRKTMPWFVGRAVCTSPTFQTRRKRP
jgi:hypothetical protein